MNTLYHATTPKKYSKYAIHNEILRPVRGFSTLEAAELWASKVGRTIIIKLTNLEPSKIYKLPDHHNKYGLAYWYDGECKIAQESIVKELSNKY